MRVIEKTSLSPELASELSEAPELIRAKAHNISNGYM